MPKMEDAMWIAVIAVLAMATVSRVAALRNIVFATA